MDPCSPQILHFDIQKTGLWSWPWLVTLSSNWLSREFSFIFIDLRMNPKITVNELEHEQNTHITHVIGCFKFPEEYGAEPTQIQTSKRNEYK